MNPAIRACIPTFDAHRRIPATRRPSDKRAARARLRPPAKPTHHALMVGHELSSRHKARRIRTVVAEVETSERRTASNHDHPPKTKSMNNPPTLKLRNTGRSLTPRFATGSQCWRGSYPSFHPPHQVPCTSRSTTCWSATRLLACGGFPFNRRALNGFRALFAKDTGVGASKRTLGESQHSLAFPCFDPAISDTILRRHPGRVSRVWLRGEFNES
jgi:hypothetical protein